MGNGVLPWNLLEDETAFVVLVVAAVVVLVVAAVVVLVEAAVMVLVEAAVMVLVVSDWNFLPFLFLVGFVLTTFQLQL